MTISSHHPEAISLKASLDELANRIACGLQEDGTMEMQPGIFFYRASASGEPIHAVLEPSCCVIAQGAKETLIADEIFRYDPAHYMITTMQLPLVGKVVKASPDQPYLGVRIVLDPQLVTTMMVEAGGGLLRGDRAVKAMNVSVLDADLLDAILRLVRLTESPADYGVLAPLVMREITYRLLKGDQGSRLQHLATLGGQSHRMAQAVKLLQEHFNQPIRIDAISQKLGMSVSGFHAHFKATTAMSPLQFQKQIRLQEARRLMLSEHLDAAEAGSRVGYEDASHFSREYKRHFGAPPMRDVERLRHLVAK
ncbi:MAG: AraC family transcriptional regulator [Leptolyngbya sp. SIO3F4]|nr:AraC family transcriptional regulator [Leptolyngbya sp. SIO3F4]